MECQGNPTILQALFLDLTQVLLPPMSQQVGGTQVECTLALIMVPILMDITHTLGV